MKLESFSLGAASLVTTLAAGSVMTASQLLVLWSVSGTICGAAFAAITMPAGSSWPERLMRALTSFFAGLFIAPWAISMIPKAEVADIHWHAFAASGIAAALSYYLVARSEPIVIALLEKFGIHMPTKKK